MPGGHSGARSASKKLGPPSVRFSGCTHGGARRVCIRATETLLAEAMLADLRARAARLGRCTCTGSSAFATSPSASEGGRLGASFLPARRRRTRAPCVCTPAAARSRSRGFLGVPTAGARGRGLRRMLPGGCCGTCCTYMFCLLTTATTCIPVRLCGGLALVSGLVSDARREIGKGLAQRGEITAPRRL